MQALPSFVVTEDEIVNGPPPATGGRRRDATRPAPPSGRGSVRLTPREVEPPPLFQAAELARRRRARGCAWTRPRPWRDRDEVCEAARDGLRPRRRRRRAATPCWGPPTCSTARARSRRASRWRRCSPTACSWSSCTIPSSAARRPGDARRAPPAWLEGALGPFAARNTRRSPIGDVEPTLRGRIAARDSTARPSTAAA